ncbi:MAG: serine--tRNA ligase, partial [Acidimicrobiales bacterium]
MIDIRLLRDDPGGVKAALARRGVEASEVDAVIAADVDRRSRQAHVEALRAEIKTLSREVGAAKKAGDEERAAALSDRSRRLGEDERSAAAEAETKGEEVRQGLLYLPNIPAEEVPDGASEADNVEIRRWWPGIDAGAPEPGRAAHQQVPHWEIGEALQLLDMERGARLSGSMFPLYRGPGARLLRALTAFALDRHSPAYEEIRPPTVVLTETMTSTGHLPKFADDAYHLERDDLWLIPTAEVPLTSMHRGEILEESQLPLRFTAATACYRREAGSAGRDTRGLLRVHEFDKVELFAYTTPEGALEAQADILQRAESMLQELDLPYRVLDLCCG